MKKLSFGYHEVIHPVDTSKVFGNKESFSFGVSNGKMYKQSETVMVDDGSAGAIREFVAAVRELDTKNQQYLCFEVFTDKRLDIFRVNVCHMKSESPRDV